MGEKLDVENPWQPIFKQIAQQAELLAVCAECEELKTAKCLIRIDRQWRFLCEECFEKNFLVRLGDNTGFDMETVERVVNGRSK